METKRKRNLDLPSLLMVLFCLGLYASIGVQDYNVNGLRKWAQMSNNLGGVEEDFEEINSFDVIKKPVLNRSMNRTNSDIYIDKYKTCKNYKEIATPPPKPNLS